MKLAISMLSLALLSLLLVASTICHALSYDVEPQLFKTENLEQSNGFGRLPVNERLDLKQLYDELYNGGVEKRAPAAGFFGMRGKKIPGQNFYGMRGKKAPSGFMGMRGKKLESKSKELNDNTLPLSFIPFSGAVASGAADKTGDEYWNSKEVTQEVVNLKKLLGENINLDDHDHEESKRAPSQGFLGLRGKRGQ